MKSNLLISILFCIFLTTSLKAQQINEHAVSIADFNIPKFVSKEGFGIDITLQNKGSVELNEVVIKLMSDQLDPISLKFDNLSIKPQEEKTVKYPVRLISSKYNIHTTFSLALSSINQNAVSNLTKSQVTKTTYILNETARKKALIEHFTNASCPPCAQENPILNALITDPLVKNKVAHVAYHTSWPGTDPMYTFNSINRLGNARVEYYSVPWVPHVVFAGDVFTGAPSEITMQHIKDEYDDPGLLKIIQESTKEGDELTLNVNLVSLADFTSEKLVAHVLLVEDMFYSYAPGNNGEKEFHNAMRYMFPDEDGTDMGVPKLNDTIKLEFTQEIDSKIDYKNLKLVVFVQEKNTKEIFMSNMYDSFDNYVGIEDFGKKIDLQIFPNPTSDYTNINFSHNKNTTGNIKVIGYTGQLFSHKELQINQGINSVRLDLSLFPKGVYFIQVNVDQSVSTTKLIIN